MCPKLFEINLQQFSLSLFGRNTLPHLATCKMDAQTTLNWARIPSVHMCLTVMLTLLLTHSLALTIMVGLYAAHSMPHYPPPSVCTGMELAVTGMGRHHNTCRLGTLLALH
jgi:hypothetical protein